MVLGAVLAAVPTPVRPADTVTVRTDENGAYTATIDLDLTAQPLNSRDSFPAPVSLQAYWRAPTGRLVFARATVNVQGPFGSLQIRTSIRAPRLPGVPFSIIADRVLTSDGPVIPGPPATITSTPIDAALCAQLSTCDSFEFDSLFDRSLGQFRAAARLGEFPVRGVPINVTESDLLRTAGQMVCAGISTSSDDWTACRYELPVNGLFALMACGDAVDEECSVAYKCAHLSVRTLHIARQQRCLQCAC